jgi:hypothetical protein
MVGEEKTQKSIYPTKFTKKSLKRISLLLFIITIICLFICYNPLNLIPNHYPTWAYVKYDTDFNSTLSNLETIEVFYPHNWPKDPSLIRVNSLGDMPADLEELLAPYYSIWFEEPRSVQVGLGEEAFTFVPDMTLYSLIALLIIEFFIIIFSYVIDKEQDYNLIKFSLIHGVLLTLLLLPCVFILFLVSRFPGSYILIQQHWGPPIQALFEGTVDTITHWTYIVPQFLVFFMFVLLILIFWFINLNFTIIKKEMKKKSDSSSLIRLTGEEG